jgi:hypothetical protein
MRVFNDFPHALPVIEAVMERGARTHSEDWRALPAGFHLARARRYLDLLAIGDVSEPHLAHAACRLLMELERDTQVAPDANDESANVASDARILRTRDGGCRRAGGVYGIRCPETVAASTRPTAGMSAALLELSSGSIVI